MCRERHRSHQEKDRTILHAKGFFIYLWDVPGAKTVADAVPQAGKIIKSEFVEFAASETKDLKVAGHDAKHLMGKGEEADDNDPGSADVVIFTDGAHVPAACPWRKGRSREGSSNYRLKVLKTIK